MAVNMFEGARRIAKLVTAIAVIGTLIALFMSKPYAVAHYLIESPGGPALKNPQCPENSAKEWITVETKEKKSVYVALCFAARDFNQGKHLVPFKIDTSGMVWGGERFSPEVTAYTSAVKDAFRFSAMDDAWESKQWSEAYWSDVREGLLYLLIGVVCFWGFVFALGWIIRGFAGIPLGSDWKE